MSAPWAIGEHHDEDGGVVTDRMNWLRAAVLGANDGIVSTAGLVVGVAAATTDSGAIAIAGLAGLVAGAMSMAAGEYVSVSTQRDNEKAVLDAERRELAADPQGEQEELAEMLQAKGISPDLAEQVAAEMHSHDALGAHAEFELGIDPDELTSPWEAAWASLVSFTLGALLPLLTITLTPADLRLPVTIASVAVALALTGWTAAWLGRSWPARAVLRNVAGGLLAMGVTFLIGDLFGTNLA